MYMAEDYNSPQSVYWCLKSLIVAGLSEDSAFWAAPELPHPLNVPDHGLLHTAVVAAPRQILVGTPEHHFLLAAEQMTRKNYKAREAKYAKFEYSSAFGFSVGIGPLLEQVAPDSTLCVSIDGGESWRVRWEVYDVQFGALQVDGETVPTLASTWKPWTWTELQIRTTLVAPCQRHPGWHLRLHEVWWKRDAHDKARHKMLSVVDGGFAISAQTADDESLWERPYQREEEQAGEGWRCDQSGCLVQSSAGASGVLDLTKEFGVSMTEYPMVRSKAAFIKPDANTNIVAQRTLLPSVQHEVDYAGPGDDRTVAKLCFVSGVFAVPKSSGLAETVAWDLWKNPPKGRLKSSNSEDGMGVHLEYV